MEKADEIWNGALEAVPASDLAGDVALHWALLAHGMVQNGGVLHAAEGLDERELAAACAGYTWLELGEVADLVREITIRFLASAPDDDSVGTLELEANARYAALLPDDEALDAAFRNRLAWKPESFAEPGAPRGWRRYFSR